MEHFERPVLFACMDAVDRIMVFVRSSGAEWNGAVIELTDADFDALLTECKRSAVMSKIGGRVTCYGCDVKQGVERSVVRILDGTIAEVWP